MDSPTFTVEQQLRAQLVLARMANVQLTAQRDMLISIMRQEMHKTVAPANMFESLPMRLLPAPKTAFPFSPAASPAAGPVTAASPAGPVTAASPAASPAAVLADVTPVLSDAPVTFASMAAKAPVVNKPIVLPPRPGTKTPDNHSDAENVSGRLTPVQSMSHIEKAMRDIRTA
jgi:hypothetical protein